MNETMPERPAKPLPRPAPESLPFWEGAKRQTLMLPFCRSCQRFWFPPSNRCRRCLSDSFEWRETSGKGRVYSFVVFHRVYHPAFEADIPYVVAVVELDEGPRLLSNIVGAPVDGVHCDARVEVVFETAGDWVIPRFKLAS